MQLRKYFKKFSLQKNPYYFSKNTKGQILKELKYLQTNFPIIRLRGLQFSGPHCIVAVLTLYRGAGGIIINEIFLG